MRLLRISAVITGPSLVSLFMCNFNIESGAMDPFRTAFEGCCAHSSVASGAATPHAHGSDVALSANQWCVASREYKYYVVFVACLNVTMMSLVVVNRDVFIGGLVQSGLLRHEIAERLLSGVLCCTVCAAVTYMTTY